MQWIGHADVVEVATLAAQQCRILDARRAGTEHAARGVAVGGCSGCRLDDLACRYDRVHGSARSGGFRCRLQRRGHDVLVAGAAAQVPRQHDAHGFLVGRGVVAQQFGQ